MTTNARILLLAATLTAGAALPALAQSTPAPPAPPPVLEGAIGWARSWPTWWDLETTAI